MKNYLFLIFLLLILVSGCSQEDLLKNQSTNLPIVTAGFEQTESRTYVEEGNLLRWTENDQISFFYKYTLNYQYKFDGETGDNAGTFSPVTQVVGTGNDLAANYAVYPYALDITISESGIITATLPAEQNYAANSFGLGANTMVAVTENIDDTFLKFKNVGGYLKLQLYGEDVTVKSITLTGNNNEKLAGQVTITPVFGQDPTISMADDATNSIKLSCGENGVKIGSVAETATAFWLVVPPTTFENGFEVTITDADGGTMTKSTSNKISIERNVIKPMEALEVEFEETIPNNQIWYTSSDGNVITPYKTDVFGATITSNTYENGKGVITFDGDVTTIEKWGFYHCSLVSITLPNNLKTIGEQAFYGCSSLTDVNISKSVTKIGIDAFGYCTSLTNIIIPNNVTTIEAGVFRGCESLSNIIIEEGNSVYDSRNNCNAIVETASNTLISGCKNTIIPNSVTTIGKSAFRACPSLTSIIIPNSVTTIDYYAFGHCTSLTEITIPSSVSNIGDSAFYECNSLSIVNVEATVPPTIEDPVDTFKNCSSDLKIYVPTESLDDYKAATGWKNFNLLTKNQ